MHDKIDALLCIENDKTKTNAAKRLGVPLNNAVSTEHI